MTFICVDTVPFHQIPTSRQINPILPSRDLAPTERSKVVTVHNPILKTSTFWGQAKHTVHTFHRWK